MHSGNLGLRNIENHENVEFVVEIKIKGNKENRQESFVSDENQVQNVVSLACAP